MSSQTAAGKFVVAYADVPDAETSQLFAAVKDARVKRTTFEISTVESITVEGSVGEALILTSDVELIPTYVLLGNSRVYVIGVRQPKENASSEAVNKFLMSFALNAD